MGGGNAGGEHLEEVQGEEGAFQGAGQMDCGVEWETGRMGSGGEGSGESWKGWEGSVH